MRMVGLPIHFLSDCVVVPGTEYQVALGRTRDSFEKGNNYR